MQQAGAQSLQAGDHQAARHYLEHAERVHAALGSELSAPGQLDLGDACQADGDLSAAIRAWVKAITAGALVFAIGGVMLIGQPFERQASVPGAQSDAVIAEFVTIESTEELSAFEYDADGNEVIRMTKETSDPRLSGTWTEVWGCGGEPVELCVASVLVENEGGSWVGRANGFGGPPAGFYDFTVLEGQGDYAGLTAIRQVTFRPDQGDTEVVAIYEGELPPLPELPVE